MNSASCFNEAAAYLPRERPLDSDGKENKPPLQ